jgi:hypothetical protein
MTTPFTTQTSGHVVSVNIYVKSDGKTVCTETDKDVAELKHAAGERITEAQKASLIFPSGTPEPIPDAEQRASEPQDAQARRKGK